MKKYTMLRTVQAACDDLGTRTAWYMKGEEYSEVSTPPLIARMLPVFIANGWCVESDELGTPPPEEAVLNTALDAPTVTASFCAAVKRNGEICGRRRPCKYHDKGK